MIELERDRLERGRRKYSLHNSDWKEEDHPRADDGKFGIGGNESSGGDGTDNLKKWIKDSKIKNPDGSPKKIYHGTSKNVDKLDQEKSSGMIWLTGDKEYADYFAGKNGKTIEMYADIHNPLDASDFQDENNLPFWQEKLEEMGIDTEDIDWDKADWAPSYGAYTFFDLLPHAGNNYIDVGVLDAIKNAGYDGIMAPPEENDGISSDYTLVAFDKNQLKKTNEFDNSIRVYRGRS